MYHRNHHLRPFHIDWCYTLALPYNQWNSDIDVIARPFALINWQLQIRSRLQNATQQRFRVSWCITLVFFLCLLTLFSVVRGCFWGTFGPFPGSFRIIPHNYLMKNSCWRAPGLFKWYGMWTHKMGKKFYVPVLEFLCESYIAFVGGCFVVRPKCDDGCCVTTVDL